jgi:hypothetical protein
LELRADTEVRRISLPIGYLLDDAREAPGILASQSIEFSAETVCSVAWLCAREERCSAGLGGRLLQDDRDS